MKLERLKKGSCERFTILVTLAKVFNQLFGKDLD
jgi:hypothetical protein